MNKIHNYFRKAELLFFVRKRLFLALVWGAIPLALMVFIPAAAEAANFSRPAYIEELENYQFSVAQYKTAQEKRKREEILEKALVQHQIKPGETLSGIAGLYGTTVQALAHWNNISNPHFIRAGQVLDIITVEGSLHHVRKGDTLEHIAYEYNVEPSAIAAFNLLDDRKMFEGQKLVIPGGVCAEEKGFVPAAVLASRGARHIPEGVSPAPLFEWPVTGKITSYFGMRNGLFHFGLDIAAPYGEAIRAAAGGTVEYNGIQTGYGRIIIIDHGRGWRTLYAHNSKNLVSEGEAVSTGQVIARIGASGNATGPHIHLEIIYGSKKLDPLPFLP